MIFILQARDLQEVHWPCNLRESLGGRFLLQNHCMGNTNKQAGCFTERQFCSGWILSFKVSGTYFGINVNLDPINLI